MITVENTHVDRRQFERFPLMLDGEVSISGGTHACEVYEIAEHGAKFRLKHVDLATEIAVSDELVLSIFRFGGFDGEITWTDEDFVGIRFVENHKAMIGLILEDADRTR